MSGLSGASNPRNDVALLWNRSGESIASVRHLYEVKRVVEKPTPTLAEQELTVSGFRSGTYLCFFGMQVLTPSVMNVMAALASKLDRPFSLSEAMNEVANRERYLACQIQGTRYNMGVRYGLLNTQLALSLSGVDRDGS